MIELPEAITLSRQLNKTITEKTVHRVSPPTKPHKFCWFAGDPADYTKSLSGRAVLRTDSFGIFVETVFEDNVRLCINDGVNIRLIDKDAVPKDYQLLIEFTDGTALVFTVAMYGGIVLHRGENNNEYYLASRNSVSPLSPDFSARYYEVLSTCNPKLSAKAFLATEQRFAGIGNGVLQDILFKAGVHPKRKIATLNTNEKDNLLYSVISVLDSMTKLGGRDTEKDLFGNFGGYITQMSKNTVNHGCSVCGTDIIKEAYLGGSVYYCPHCQPYIE